MKLRLTITEMKDYRKLARLYCQKCGVVFSKVSTSKTKEPPWGTTLDLVLLTEHVCKGATQSESNNNL